MERLCIYCGSLFETDQPKRCVCYTCKANNAAGYDKKPYQVVSSPVDKVTGLPEIPLSARFSYHEVLYTLKLRNFPAGLVLRKKDVDYRVVGKNLVKV